MSTSPPCSFLVAWANAASTAPKTTSRSTLFSREIASTSISISRFIACLCSSFIAQWPVEPGRRPLEARIVDGLDRQRVLQVPADALAVVHGHRVALTGFVGAPDDAIDRHAQQPARRPFGVDHVVSHGVDGALDRF